MDFWITAKRIAYKVGICLLVFPGITLSTVESRNTSDNVWMTVFVHGIMSIHPYISLGLFWKLSRDKIYGTRYADTVFSARKDPFFQHNQLMQQEGLHQIFFEKSGNKIASEVLASLYNISDEQVGFVGKNLFYTFGWSGLLSHYERIRAAQHFFFQLQKELQRLREQGIYPRIRLIGHSHGANVCINLAQIQREHPEQPLEIDTLILLGSPVQRNNDFLINDSLFKNVYNIYSKKDRVQCLDIFSHRTLFSGRTFSNRPHLFISPKVTQLNLRITRTNNHAHKKNLALIRKKRGNWRTSDKLKDQSPGHLELWFLGFTSRYYRTNFILYPYPVLLFLPFIIDALQKSNISHNGTQYRITVDIRPEFEEIIVKDNKKQYVYPFPYQHTRELFSSVLKTNIHSFTRESFGEHVNIHKRKVREERIKRKQLPIESKRLRKLLRNHKI